MAQLTIYLEEKILKKITLAAKLENNSISSWVKNKLAEVMENKWPHNYFDLFGSLADDDLKRPKSLDFKQDSSREEM